jgi:hypothetical protein
VPFRTGPAVGAIAGAFRGQGRRHPCEGANPPGIICQRIAAPGGAQGKAARIGLPDANVSAAVEISWTAANPGRSGRLKGKDGSCFFATCALLPCIRSAAWIRRSSRLSLRASGPAPRVREHKSFRRRDVWVAETSASVFWNGGGCGNKPENRSSSGVPAHADAQTSGVPYFSKSSPPPSVFA